MVEAARAALAANDVVGASSALDRHAKAYPRGVFSEEAKMLRIDVLVKRGDANAARDAARTHLAQHPTSPYRARLLQIIASDRSP